MTPTRDDSASANARNSALSPRMRAAIAQSERERARFGRMLIGRELFNETK